MDPYPGHADPGVLLFRVYFLPGKCLNIAFSVLLLVYKNEIA